MKFSVTFLTIVISFNMTGCSEKSTSVSEEQASTEEGSLTGYQACDVELDSYPEKYRKCVVSGFFGSKKIEDCPSNYFSDLAKAGIKKRNDPLDPAIIISPRCASGEINRGKRLSDYSGYEMDCKIFLVSGEDVKIGFLFSRREFGKPEEHLQEWMKSKWVL